MILTWDPLQMLLLNINRGSIFLICKNHFFLDKHGQIILDLASKRDLKIRTHDFYNPDYLLPDGTWLEITLSENTAYQKLFRYGHQAPAFKVLWLEKDTGLHKKVCKDVDFPNAEVVSVQEYYPEFDEGSGGCELVNKFHQLKRLKGIIG